jgi:hypothetical protein
VAAAPRSLIRRALLAAGALTAMAGAALRLALKQVGPRTVKPASRHAAREAFV